MRGGEHDRLRFEGWFWREKIEQGRVDLNTRARLIRKKSSEPLKTELRNVDVSDSAARDTASDLAVIFRSRDKDALGDLGCRAPVRSGRSEKAVEGGNLP